MGGVTWVVQWWEHSPPTNVARVRILASTLYVGLVCCWFSPLLWEVFLWVLRFSPLLKNQHFQIPIRSWTHGPISTSSYELLSAPWVNKLQLQLQFFIINRDGFKYIHCLVLASHKSHSSISGRSFFHSHESCVAKGRYSRTRFLEVWHVCSEGLCWSCIPDYKHKVNNFRGKLTQESNF